MLLFFRAVRLEAELGSVKNIRQCVIVAQCFVCFVNSVVPAVVYYTTGVVQAKYDAEYQSVGR